MLYYKATAGCGVGMFVGVSARKRAAPVTLILGAVCAVVAIRDRVFRLELTFSQVSARAASTYTAPAPPGR